MRLWVCYSRIFFNASFWLISLFIKVLDLTLSTGDINLKLDKAVKPYLIQNSSLWLNLPEEDQFQLFHNIKTEKAKRGTVLFRQGTTPKGVYILLKGKVKIYQETPNGHRQTIYVYSNYDMIGYRQFIADIPNPVTAAVMEESEYKFIVAKNFTKVIETSPEFARQLLMNLASEFSVWSNRLTLLMHYPVKYRVILALLIFREQFRISGAKDDMISMTRTELAEYVGATLETVVRTLHNFKADNLIEIQGRRIFLKDIPGLLKGLQDKD